MYHQLYDSSSTTARLARWAAAGPYPAYDAEVVELASIPLCWLLSTPNRFMRDWVTKALVQLLRGHLDVMRAIVERFWKVDDPYVVQRVVVVAYGSLVRSSPEQAGHAKTLVELVHSLVFTPPVRPDELLLDAGRGIVRWGIAHKLLPGTALKSSIRPYGLKTPGSAPTEATIEEKYGWHKDQPDDESYSSINFSLMTMGDFARYVVEPGVHEFSRYRIRKPYPERQGRRPRFVKSAWLKFVASLSDEQKKTLSDWLENPEERAMSPLRFMISGEKDPLTEQQRRLWDAVFVYPKPVIDEYPADAACRWIFRRTISLGWTPKLFGREDRIIGHGQGREGHKAERWGKKYQWMAYHELLARIADNFQTSRRFGNNEPYEGLHQIVGDREIDPSLPPIGYRAFNEDGGNGATAWGPSLIQLEEWPPRPLNFGGYQGDILRLLADVASEPTVASSMFVRDRNKNEWVVLESFAIKIDPQADKSWRGIQERSTIDTLLVSKDSSETFLTALSRESRRSARHLFDSHGHTACCYVGEVGRIGSACPHRYEELRSISLGGKSFQSVSTVEQYTWGGRILDCSIGDSATAILPWTFLQQSAELTFDMRGPSWLDSAGTPIFTYYEQAGSGSHALLVKKSFLQDFLAEHKLEIVALRWFERMEIKNNYNGNNPYIEANATARLSSALTILQEVVDRTERDLGAEDAPVESPS